MADEETAAMGDNSEGVVFDSEDRRALFFSHFNPIWTLEEKLDELKAEKTKLKRQAKAEGFQGYEIDEALRMRKTEKPEIIDERMKRTLAIARFMSQPIGFQVDIFDADRRPLEDKAVDDGEAAGLRADSTDTNPHATGTPLHARWNDGWRQGQDQLLAATQKRMEQANERNDQEEAARIAAEAEDEDEGNGGAPAAKKKRGAKSAAKPKGGKSFAKQLGEKNRKVDAKLKDGTLGQEEAGAAQ